MNNNPRNENVIILSVKIIETSMNSENQIIF